MRNRILTMWTFRRVIFTGLGLFLIGQSLVEKQWIGFIIGIYFASMGIFGFGCGAGYCTPVPFKKNQLDLKP